jgi:hypothetical protein
LHDHGAGRTWSSFGSDCIGAWLWDFCLSMILSDLSAEANVAMAGSPYPPPDQKSEGKLFGNML